MVDVLVLGDSPAVVEQLDRSIQVLEDKRLNDLPGRDRFGQPPADPEAALHRTRRIIAFERSVRNRPYGYWIAEADPEAARHALLAIVPRNAASAVLLLTDGVADGINRYCQPQTWSDAISLARSGTEYLVRAVWDVEETDNHCQRWPRPKIHDDKAAAFIDFGSTSGKITPMR